MRNSPDVFSYHFSHFPTHSKMVVFCPFPLQMPTTSLSTTFHPFAFHRLGATWHIPPLSGLPPSYSHTHHSYRLLSGLHRSGRVLYLTAFLVFRDLTQSGDTGESSIHANNPQPTPVKTPLSPKEPQHLCLTAIPLLFAFPKHQPVAPVH